MLFIDHELPVLDTPNANQVLAFSGDNANKRSQSMHVSPGYPAIMTQCNATTYAVDAAKQARRNYRCELWGSQTANTSENPKAFTDIDHLGLLWAAASTGSSSTTASSSSVAVASESTTASLKSIATSTSATEVATSTTVTLDFLEAIVAVSCRSSSLL